MPAVSKRSPDDEEAPLSKGQAVTLAEFQRRLLFWKRDFTVARQVLPPGNGFNASLNRVKKFAEGRPIGSASGRVHPEIELVANHHAARHAAENGRAGSINSSDLKHGLCVVADTLTARRGRPKDAVLLHYTAALVAMLEEATGRPVILRHYTNSEYDPYAQMGLGEVVISQVQACDPRVTRIAIIDAARDARRRRKQTGATFLDLMPGYGWKMMPDGQFDTSASNYRLEVLQWARPINFH